MELMIINDPFPVKTNREGGSIDNAFLKCCHYYFTVLILLWQVSKTSQEGAKSVFIGAGVYPTLALFNHSCDPCIVRYYVEDYVVVQAIKNIRKGNINFTDKPFKQSKS